MDTKKIIIEPYIIIFKSFLCRRPKMFMVGFLADLVHENVTDDTGLWTTETCQHPAAQFSCGQKSFYLKIKHNYFKHSNQNRKQACIGNVLI